VTDQDTKLLERIEPSARTIGKRIQDLRLDAIFGKSGAIRKRPSACREAALGQSD
jgi:hypothetical protein